MKRRRCVSTEPSEEKARTRNLLSHAGSQLRDNLYAITKCPSREQQDVLYAQISSLPGCEKYTKKNLSNFFSSRRRRDDRVRQDAHINAVKLTTLKGWIHECPNPTAVEMCSWAERLHLNPREIFRHVLEDGGCFAFSPEVQQNANGQFAMSSPSQSTHEGPAIAGVHSLLDVNHVLSAGQPLSMWAQEENILNSLESAHSTSNQQYEDTMCDPFLSSQEL
ncbi:hypothetical protein AcV5_010098 [Taiwanofungus camphoratus]|nr:hypothetical protein AcV5_010098 [Antrodia cinnamomea]